jgi:type II secretory pathway component PulC
MAEKTPEKRLLEIIEGKAGKIAMPSPVQLGNKYFSLGSLRARMAFFKEIFSRKRLGVSKSLFQDLKMINLVLQAVIGIAIVALAVLIRIEIKGADKISLIVGKDAQANVIGEIPETVSLLKPKEVYLQKVEVRDIFQMGYVKRKEVDFKKEEDANKTSPLAELTKNLKLVGISWSDDPDAIIENPQLEKTYFVKKGYMIDDIKVYDIQKDRVILRYKGEEVEVR